MMNFSAAAQRVLSETWSKLVEDGIGDAWLEIYSGEMPKSPDDPITTQKLLARLYIMPHTMRVEPDSAIASGDVGWVRIIGANGRAVADSVVSTKDGPGWITFNTLAFRKGGPVSFFGRVAIFSQKPIDDDDVTASIHDLTPWTTDADKPTRVARRRHVDCAPDMMGLLLRTAASQRRSLRGLGDQGVSFV